jgi:predicted NAD/FAD-dependent oxidoreductase
MEMVPRQLAVRLNAQTMQVNSRVTRLRRERNGFTVELSNGRFAAGKAVVLALPDPQARELLTGLSIRTKLGRDVQWNRTTTFYYGSHRTPVADPILILNGEGPKAGPVNNAVVMSQVNPGYAPPGAHLIAASVVGQAPEAQSTMEKLESEVREHLTRWFGADVARWQVIAGYPITRALPLCRAALWEQSAVRAADGVFLCGDYRELPSSQGALSSGRRAAEAALRQMR